MEWICGYANAYGGTLYIGKNDDGDVVGISDKDSRKLLEVIPNKITDTMGIVADVNLLYEGDLQYIEIIVEKYPSLISYHGKYFYRSGSTMRTITGKELDKAFLKSQGRTWDGMPIPKLKVEDLRREAIELFKEKAVRRGRLTPEETEVEDAILLDNLHLFDEDGYLIRAARERVLHRHVVQPRQSVRHAEPGKDDGGRGRLLRLPSVIQRQPLRGGGGERLRQDKARHRHQSPVVCVCPAAGGGI